MTVFPMPCTQPAHARHVNRRHSPHPGLGLSPLEAHTRMQSWQKESSRLFVKSGTKSRSESNPATCHGIRERVHGKGCTPELASTCKRANPLTSSAGKSKVRMMLRRHPESRAMKGRFRGSAASVCSFAMTLLPTAQINNRLHFALCKKTANEASKDTANLGRKGASEYR